MNPQLNVYSGSCQFESMMRKVARLVKSLPLVISVALVSCAQASTQSGSKRDIRAAFSQLSFEPRLQGIQVNKAFVRSGGFQSRLCKEYVTYNVVLPPTYRRNASRKYPVIYWLHGSGGGNESVIPLSKRFYRAMLQKQLEESIVVMPYGGKYSMWVNSYDGTLPVEDIVIKELLPKIDREYRTTPTSKARSLAGFSMGAYGAARFAFKYPELFSRLLMMGSGTLDLELTDTPRADVETKERLYKAIYGGNQQFFAANSPRSLAEINKKKIRDNLAVVIVVGRDDETYRANLEFSAFLKKVGITNSLVILPDVSHSLKEYMMALSNRIWQFL